jgi:chromosome segregation ATPase
MASNTDNSIVQRLKLIKSMIRLGEASPLGKQAEKLREAAGGEGALAEIVTALSENRYSDVVSGIDDFLQSEAAIRKYVDPRLAGLRLEAESLEEDISELESQKAEIDREIREFNLRHGQELGPILKEILEIQAERKRKESEERPGDDRAQAEAEEAEEEYEEYSRAVEEAQEEKRIELTEEEEDRLNKIHRQASKKCHPDMVEEGRQEEAEEVFVELQDAYERNDLDEVELIADRVETGLAFSRRIHEIDEVEKLETEIERLRQQAEDLKAEIEALRSSDAYQEITGIEDMDEYFQRQEERLKDELERLRDQEPDSPPR